MAMEKETHPAVFTEAGLEDMLDDGWVGGADLAVARVDQPAGAVLQRVPDMLVEQPVEVAELPEHRPDERRPVRSRQAYSLKQKAAKDATTPRM